jgi:Bacterial membrane protein YfhO
MTHWRKSLKSPHTAALLFIIVVYIVLCRGVFWGGSVMSSGDLSAAFFPWQTYGTEAVKAGYLPELFPRSFCGYFFIGNVQTQFFHPTFLLSLVLGPLSALCASMCLHLLLTTIGTYVYFNYLTKSVVASLFGALAFCPAGFFIYRASVGHTTVLFSLAPLPWVLYCAELLLDGKRAWPFVGLVLGMSLSLLGGHPQFTLYILIALAWVVLYRFSREPERLRAWSRGTGWIAGAGIVFLLVTCAQLLPTYEVIQNLGDRDPDSVYRFCVKDSVTPLTLLTLLHSNAVGLRTDLVSGNEFWASHSGWHEINMFIGVTTLCVMLGFMCYINKRRRRWLLAMLFIILILAMGNHTPIYGFLYKYFPPVRLFRGASRIQCMLQFFMAMTAALGLAGALRRKEDKRKWVVITMTAFIGSWLLLLAFMVLSYEETIQLMARGANRAYRLCSMDIPYDLGNYTAWNGYLQKFYEDMLSRLLLHWGLALLVVLPLILAVVEVRSKRIATWCACALCALCVVESGVLFYRNIDIISRPEFMQRYFHTTPVIEHMKKQEGHFRFIADDSLYALDVRRRFMNYFPNRIGMHGLRNARGYERLLNYRYTHYFNMMMEREPDAYLGMIFKLPSFSSLSVPMMERLNIRYFLSKETLSDPVLKEDFSNNSVKVYRFNNNLGPAYFCKQECLVAGATAATPKAPGSVNYREINPEDMMVEVEANEDCVLTFSQICFPGWRAWLDSKPVEVEEAFGTFVAVRVPAGKHKVRLEYRSGRIRAGMALSVSGLLLCAGVFFYLRRKETGQNST